MASFEISDEDREFIRELLVRQQQAGVESPMLPLNVDVDGDGIVDAFALDADGNVTLVSNVPLDATMYEATGEEE